MSMMWGQSSAARILCIVCTFYTFAVVATASNSTSPAAIGASLVDEESGEVVAAGQPALKGQSVSKWQHIMMKRRGKKGLKTRRRGRPNGRPNNRRPGQAPSRQQRPNRPNNRPSRQQRPNRQQNNNNNRPNRQDTNDSSAQNAIQSPSCFSVEIYDDIDRDIGSIKSSIRNDEDRSHFLGGIVRLAAHDFMDFNPRTNPQFGPDGCFDANHASNAGLDTIWCRSCPLKILYDEKYSHLSRADYWIAAANAVVRQTSVDNQLDLKDTFVWGRKDRDVCRGSGDRLPQASDCGEVEDVFLKRMGLEWKDAVALLGAHTLGRGDAEFSGHDGTWVESDSQAQVFDKSYFEAMFTDAWRPRRMGGAKQDWTTGRGGNTRLMLNTDMCLLFDIDQHIRQRAPCCTKTNSHYSDGQNECIDREAARSRCPMYSQHDERREATEAVRHMLGGKVSSDNNGPFYDAFTKAWRKATTVGTKNLSRLQDSCESV